MTTVMKNFIDDAMNDAGIETDIKVSYWDYERIVLDTEDEHSYIIRMWEVTDDSIDYAVYESTEEPQNKRKKYLIQSREVLPLNG